ncbi:MAG: glycosyltransferase family 9 protein [Planctomycetes bacterium]|nr:glycosyltransferase family 9 protein [Planctomycetota bacterium]
MRKPPWLSTSIAKAWSRWRAWRSPPPTMVPLPADTSARILVANTTGIGDTLFCTAPIADLRESFPNAEIDVLVDRRRLGLVENNPRINRIITYKGKYKQVRATISELRSRAYTVAMIQHVNDPDIVPLIALGRPQYIVGYRNHTLSRLYSVALPDADKKSGVHTLDARLALCKAIGAKGEHWHMEMYPAAKAKGAASRLLAEFGLAERTAVALNIGGSAPRKRWPAERWAELAQALAQRGLPVILMGGPDDKAAAAQINDRLNGASGVHSAVAQLGLQGDIALLPLCRVHVSGDTGLLHAGLAQDVPTVALFGPNEPGWTGPHPKQQHAIVLQPDPASWPPGYAAGVDKTGVLMQMIGADQVIGALSALGV